MIHQSNSMVVLLFSRIPLYKMAHAPTTAAHKRHPTNVLHEGKHVYGIVLANIALKTTK